MRQLNKSPLAFRYRWMPARLFILIKGLGLGVGLFSNQKIRSTPELSHLLSTVCILNSKLTFNLMNNRVVLVPRST